MAHVNARVTVVVSAPGMPGFDSKGDVSAAVTLKKKLKRKLLNQISSVRTT